MNINRRKFIETSALAAFGATTLAGCKSLSGSASKPTSVILATDIGDDIDDTWALGFLLKCPELRLKLVMTEYGKAPYRAKIIAKFLEKTGHGDVPIALGPDAEPRGEGGQAEWVKDYDLRSYPGKIHEVGVGAFVNTIMLSPEPVTVIGIGPMPNVAAALEREPRIAGRARFVGMDGSVRLGYDGSKNSSAEWNVKADVAAAKRGLAANWDITITPLDTCGLVQLDGERYQKVLHSTDPVAATVIENYRIWSKAGGHAADAELHSSTLFDTVAVYLAFAHDLCKMERLGIRVTNDGFTEMDASAKQMNVATGWKDLDGFRDLLVNRLCGL